MKRILVAITLTAIILWGFGFWTPSFSIYWRRPAQTTLLAAGRILPSFLSRRVTHLALKTHVEGISVDEIEFAAVTLEKIGEKRAAAVLQQAAVRHFASRGDWDRAISHAKISQQLVSSEKALSDLVKLTINKPESGEWIPQIQQAFPDNEISQATLCRSQLESFQNEIPASCQRVAWLSEAANSSKHEYHKLSQQINDLPQEAQRRIGEYEAKLRVEKAERAQHYAELADIDQKKTQASLDAAIEFGVDVLPLPKADDTLESYVVREGLCLFPIIRWFCAAVSAQGPVARMVERHKQLEELRELTSQLIGYNNKLIGRYREGIAYWQSTKPLEELKSEREGLTPKFRTSITDTISSGKDTTGISVSEAIASMTF